MLIAFEMSQEVVWWSIAAHDLTISHFKKVKYFYALKSRQTLQFCSTECGEINTNSSC